MAVGPKSRRYREKGAARKEGKRRETNRVKGRQTADLGPKKQTQEQKRCRLQKVCVEELQQLLRESKSAFDNRPKNWNESRSCLKNKSSDNNLRPPGQVF